MLILVLLFLLTLAALGWYFSRDVFAPYVALPGIWCIIISLYYFIPNDLYPIQHQLPVAISIWMLIFFVSSCAVGYFTKCSTKKAVSQKPNMKVIYAYIWISVIIVPIISFVIIHQAIIEDPEAVFRYLRIMSTGSDENIEAPTFGPLIYCTSIAYVSIFLSIIYVKKKKAVFTILFVNLLFAIITMAKTSFLSVFFSSLYVGYKYGYIKKKHLLFGFIIFLLTCYVVQMARFAGEDFSIMEMLVMYLSTSIVAFDYFIVPVSSATFGAYTFRVIYAIGYSFGICEAPVNTILPFVSTPDLTNTYTILFPFYSDFGIIGVMVFSALYGCFYGFLYKKSVTGGNLATIIYAIFLTYLLMSFIGEFIFTNFSLSLQYVFWAILPFLLSSKKEQCVK